MIKRSEQKSAKRNHLRARLAAYGATAGAALACAPGAAAGLTLIDHSNLTVNGSPVDPSTNPAYLEIPDSTGVASVGFQFNDKDNEIIARDFATGGLVALAAGIAYSTVGTHKLGLKLALGAPIAVGGRHFTTTAGRVGPILASDSAGGNAGNFREAAGGTGYVGFKFVEGGKDYYGWLRVEVNSHHNTVETISLIPLDGTDIYGAYADALSGIIAGAVPEPSAAALSGLGLLALGAFGLRELRRRKAVLEIKAA